MLNVECRREYKYKMKNEELKIRNEKVNTVPTRNYGFSFLL